MLRLSTDNSFGFKEEAREREQVKGKGKERVSQLSVFKSQWDGSVGNEKLNRDERKGNLYQRVTEKVGRQKCDHPIEMG